MRDDGAASGNEARSRRGAVAAARAWASSDIRRRWRSLVVLGILTGLAAGLSTAAFVGARRTQSAFPRLRKVTNSSDAVVFPSQVGNITPDWTRLRAQPYLAGLARWKIVFGLMEGSTESLPMFIPADEHWLGDIDRPVVIRGRMFDRTAADEVVIDEETVRFGLDVGSAITFRAFGPKQDDTTGDAPTGPTLRLRVVGVIRETSQFLFSGGFIFPTPAVLVQHSSEMLVVENAHVQLRDPDRDISLLQRDVNTMVAKGAPVLDLHAQERRIGTGLVIERSALLLLSGAVALAGLVFAGQALARSSAAVAADSTALRTIGFTRLDFARAAALPHLITAAAAVLTALATAIALSTRFPIGFARRVDPDIGLYVDVPILITGALLTLVFVVACAVFVGRRSALMDRHLAPRRHTLGSDARRLLPLPVGLGTAMALDSGSGRTKVAVRPALIGAIAGVLGVVAVMTIGHGLDNALNNPERVGVTWQVLAVPRGFSPTAPDTLAYARRIAAVRDVGSVSFASRQLAEVNGVGVQAVSMQQIRGDVSLVTLQGRAPAKDDEAAIGPGTARQLGVGIGERVRLARSDGGTSTVLVVGTALFPGEVHGGINEGVWITPALFERAVGKGERYVMLRWRDGVDPDAALTRLQQRFGTSSSSIEAAMIPQELTNLATVRRIPIALVVFLVLFAIATLLHALVSSVNTRAKDFAVLRAIGFTRPMTRTVVGMQGLTVGMVGLLVGIPIGAATGRVGWVWLTDRVPLQYVSPIAVSLMVIVIVAALLIANAVAVVPARRAASLDAAKLLRAE